MWTPEADAMVRKLAPTKTAAEIAAVLGTTRNAVLGRAHRQGLSLFHPNKDGANRMSERGRKGGLSRKGKRLPDGHPALRSRPKGTAAFTLKQRAAAVAALMAGASYRIAGEMVGASKVTVDKLWRRDPVVRAEARIIFDAAYADAAARKATQLRLLAMQRRAVDTLNDRVLADWNERNRTIAVRRARGEILEAIGNDYGVTRERIRQIVSKAIKRGLLPYPGVSITRERW